MSTVTFQVTEGFVNPVPTTWSKEDQTLVIQLGHACMHLVKQQQLEPNHDNVYEKLEYILSLNSETIQHENTELRMQASKHKDIVAKFTKEMESLEEKLRLQHKVALQQAQAQAQSDAKAAVDTHYAEQILNLQGQLQGATQAAEMSRKTHVLLLETNTKEMKSLRDENVQQLKQLRQELEFKVTCLQDDKEKLRQELQEQQRKKTPNEKGSKFERETSTAFEQNGFCVMDTSAGRHNTHYHDALVSKNPITELPSGEYKTTGSMASHEKKCYDSKSNIAEEIRKFKVVRAEMQKEGRADCFLFHATRTIPERNNKQQTIQYELLEDGRYSVTGWLGGQDIPDDVYVDFLDRIIDIQDVLTNVTVVPSEDKTMEHLKMVGEETMSTARQLLVQVDNLTGQMKQLEKTKEVIRRGVVEMLIGEYYSLRENKLLRKTDGDMDMLVDAVFKGGEKPKTSKIITKDEDLSYLKDVMQLRVKRQRADTTSRSEQDAD